MTTSTEQTYPDAPTLASADDVCDPRPTDRQIFDWFVTTVLMFGGSYELAGKCAGLFLLALSKGGDS